MILTLCRAYVLYSVRQVMRYDDDEMGWDPEI
jgi:hypothetical protein